MNEIYKLYIELSNITTHSEDEENTSCIHNRIYICGLYTCINCGSIEPGEQLINTQSHYDRKLYLYKRRHYFRSKVKLLSGNKQFSNTRYMQQYKNMISHLKKLNISSIQELKHLLRKHNYNRFLVYIYNIYYEITGIRLYQIPYNMINRMVEEFLLIEDHFKKKIGKRNIFNYNSMLYFLLKRHNYNTKHIFLSSKHKKIIEFIENI